jgi:signal transduction histidine kinase
MELGLSGAERWWQGVPGVVAFTLAVAVRRRAPFAAMLLTWAGLGSMNVADKEISENLFGPFMLLLYVTFNWSLHTDQRALAAGTVLVWCMGLALVFTDQYATTAGDLVFVTLLTTAFPILSGQLVRSRIRLAAALREKAQRLEAEREHSVREAAERERERIASELHDVVAHALGAMTIQASAARRLTGKDDEKAGAAFMAVEQTGREALTELRTLLGVLRREDEELALAPQPSLSHISSLVGRVRAAGLPVELDIRGDAPDEVPAGVDLTAYRLVQEALGEAVRQGRAGSAIVKIRYDPGSVGVEVSDDGAEGERRLLGMRERVQLFGGTLEAGARRDGGHLVRARLPMETAS